VTAPHKNVELTTAEWPRL